jgi:hypothetical protein
MAEKSRFQTIECIEKQYETEYDKCLERINSYAKDGSFIAYIIFHAEMKESNVERLRQQGYKVKYSHIGINYCYTISWEKEVEQKSSVIHHKKITPEISAKSYLKILSKMKK